MVVCLSRGKVDRSVQGVVVVQVILVVQVLVVQVTVVVVMV